MSAKLYIGGEEIAGVSKVEWALDYGREYFDASAFGPTSMTFTIPFTIPFRPHYAFGMVTRSRGGAMYMLLGDADEKGIAKAICLKGWGGVSLGRVTSVLPANQEIVHLDAAEDEQVPEEP